MHNFGENIDPKIENPKQKNKDPKIIEIAGRQIMDVDNEEGALIRPDGLLFVDLKGGKGETFVKEFKEAEGITSHSYMGCAEIIGKLSNGYGFYFHSRGPHSFELFMQKALSLIGDDSVKIADIEIRGEFERNASNGEDKDGYAKREMGQYAKVCKNFGSEDGTAKIRQESITGFAREKVVGFSWSEDRG